MTWIGNSLCNRGTDPVIDCNVMDDGRLAWLDRFQKLRPLAACTRRLLDTNSPHDKNNKKNRTAATSTDGVEWYVLFCSFVYMCMTLAGKCNGIRTREKCPQSTHLHSTNVYVYYVGGLSTKRRGVKLYAVVPWFA